MSTTEPRRVAYGSHSQPAYFHQWLIKTFDDEPNNQHSYALIEMEDGTTREVPAHEIRFVN